MTATCSNRRPRQRTIRSCAYTVCFGLALLGLLGNIVQLRYLTNAPDAYDNGMVNHLMNHYLTAGKRRSTQSMVLSQDVSFRQILKRTTSSQQVCDNHNHAIINDAPREKESQSRRQLLQEQQHQEKHGFTTASLPRFGVIESTTNYLSESPHEEEECLLSPSTSCDVSGYSMLVTSFGETSNLRILFVNLLLFLTYPNVKEILVLIHHNNKPSNNATRHLQQDAKYGQRLLAWHDDHAHKVKFLFSSNNETNNTILWDTIGNSDLFKSKAVLWLDGDEVWQGNGRGLNVGFELWKRHSQSLVAFGGYNIHVHETLPSGTSQQQHDNGDVSLRHLETHHATLNSTTPFSLDTGFFLPTCPDYEVRAVQDGYSYDDFQLVDVSAGLFFHSNLLCFFKSGVFEEIRQYLAKAEPGLEERVLMEKLAMGIVLTQVTGELPRLYPSKVQKGKGQEASPIKSRRLTSNEPSSVKTGTKTNTLKKSLRGKTLETTGEHDLVHQKPKLKESSWESTAVGLQEPRPLQTIMLTTRNVKTLHASDKTPVGQSPQEKKAKLNSFNKKILTDLVGYFGNMPPGAIGWCSGSNSNINSGSASSGQHRCPSHDNVVLEDIPWMNWGGVGNAVCYSWSDKLFR